MLSKTIERFSYLMEIIPALLQKIPESDFCDQANPSKWSKKQILGHLIDSAANNHQRFIRAQYENTPTIAYHADSWNTLNLYTDLPTSHIIDFWSIYNRHLLALMKNISPHQLTKTCITGETEALTLGWLMEDYVHHLEHHLKQLINY